MLKQTLYMTDKKRANLACTQNTGRAVDCTGIWMPGWGIRHWVGSGEPLKFFEQGIHTVNLMVMRRAKWTTLNLTAEGPIAIKLQQLRSGWGLVILRRWHQTLEGNQITSLIHSFYVTYSKWGLAVNCHIRSSNNLSPVFLSRLSLEKNGIKCIWFIWKTYWKHLI